MANGESRATERTKRPGIFLGFAAFVIAIVTAALWVRQINMVAIPEDKTLFIASFLTAVVLGVASFIVGTRWFAGIAAVPAILISLILPYTIYISPQQVSDNPIQVGDTIPQFVAIDDEGNRFFSDSLEGSTVLIKFFRAHW